MPKGLFIIWSKFCRLHLAEIWASQSTTNIAIKIQFWSSPRLIRSVTFGQKTRRSETGSCSHPEEVIDSSSFGLKTDLQPHKKGLGSFFTFRQVNLSKEWLDSCRKEALSVETGRCTTNCSHSNNSSNNRNSNSPTSGWTEEVILTISLDMVKVAVAELSNSISLGSCGFIVWRLPRGP